ncbi:polysaccharide deacetylase family protein [uncultured Microbacterium sp.]|uniref:polysaccharide deacetylase family protein n=1 Tax=uncultured Microbacterium sp. TaxID=191216 RepID=UPI0025D1F63B|nr:polysaccharide deacetylase family protein [uncultured Microbacterium sp.]
MTTPPVARSRAHRTTRPSVARALIAVLAAALIGALAGLGLWSSGFRAVPSAAGPDSTPVVLTASSPSPRLTPSSATPAEALLATTTDPQACAVSFAGDDPAVASLAPLLETQGTRYSELPIPRRDGAVFAGWYTSAADAAAYTSPARMNPGRLVTCANQRQTLYAAWKTPAQVAADKVAVPILMYHQFTDKPGGESGWLRLNYLYIGDFDQQMKYLHDQQFYLPSWPELEAFIDGTLALPPRSVIVTDDDADSTWHALAVPVVEKYQVLTTSFVITKWFSQPLNSPWVLERSHTNDMHDAGANGKGRMVNYTLDQIVADMNTSAQLLGAKEVMAYPFGHYNATAEQALTEAGFDLARTTEHGYVRQGTKKLELPCIRMDYGTSMQTFIKSVG